MKAIYRNRLCRLVETTGDVALLDEGEHRLIVPLGSVDLVIDPTDEQLAGVDNLRGVYGLDEEASYDFRAMLTGALSTADWQKSRRNG
jgi:hypothetical protein